MTTDAATQSDNTPAAAPHVYRAGDLVTRNSDNIPGVVYANQEGRQRPYVLWEDDTEAYISADQITPRAQDDETPLSAAMLQRVQRVMQSAREAHERVLVNIREAAIQQYRNGGTICREGLQDFLRSNGMEELGFSFDVTITARVQVDATSRDRAVRSLRNYLTVQSSDYNNRTTVSTVHLTIPEEDNTNIRPTVPGEDS